MHLLQSPASFKQPTTAPEVGETRFTGLFFFLFSRLGPFAGRPVNPFTG